MKLVLVVLAVLVGLIMVVVGVGYLLPEKHVAARAITLRQKPQDVFALISNFAAASEWRSDVQSVELLPPLDGHVRYRERSKDGNVLTMEVAEISPPVRLVGRIADPKLPFGGAWIFEVSPTSEGCRLNITERGEIYNPVFRFVSRFILGYNRTLDTYLKNVSRKFGESAVPVEGRPAAQ